MKSTIYNNHNICEIDELLAVVKYCCDQLVCEVHEKLHNSTYEWSLDYGIASCTICSTDAVTVHVNLISDREDSVGHLSIKHTRAGVWEIKTELNKVANQYFDQVMEYVIYDQLK